MGQPDFSAKYQWAPILSFEPKEPRNYRLHGELAVTSGKASKQDDPETMSWSVLRIPAEPKAPVTPDADLRVYRLLRPFDTASGSPVAGENYASEALASVPVELKALGSLAGAWASTSWRGRNAALLRF